MAKGKWNRWLLACRKALPFLLLGAALAQLILIGLYQYRYYFYSVGFDSDAAAEILYAEHLFEKGRLLLSGDWYYSTELRIMNGHLLMRPVFYFTGSYRVVTAVNAVGSALLVYLGAVYCLRKCGLALTWAMAAGSLFILPIGIEQNQSYYVTFFGAAYYAWFLVNGLLFFGLWQRFGQAGGRLKWMLGAGLGAYSVVLGLCGMRYALLVVAPLLLCEVLRLLVWEKEDFSLIAAAKQLAPAVAAAVCWFVGYLICTAVLEPLYGVQGVDMFFARSEQWEGLLSAFARDALASFGADFSGGKVMTALGIANGVQIVFGLAVLFSAAALLRGIKKLPRGVAMYVLFAVCVFVVNSAAVLLMGTVVLRYVVLGAAMLLPLPLVWLAFAARKPMAKAFMAAVLAAAVLGTGFVAAAVHHPYEDRFSSAYVNDEGRNVYGTGTSRNYLRYGYISFLREQGLTLGWGDFWDAGVTTVLSEGEIRMVAVEARRQEFVPIAWLQQRQDVENPASPEFILVRRDNENTYIERGLLGEALYVDDYYAVYSAGGNA